MTNWTIYELILETGITCLEVEKSIIENEITSYYYSKYIIKNRFKLGENKISQSSYYSYLYALEVLKDRFKLGETMNNYHMNIYIKTVLLYNHD